MSLYDTLRDYWGYSSFLPQQTEAISAIYLKQDVLLLKATGGGKSLCYQILPVHEKKLGIVVSPLISLMKDQVDDLCQKGIRAVTLNSDSTPDEKRRTETAIREGKIHLLYVSPERFVSERFVRLLKNIPLSLIAIDEAHCISRWGHDFRPDYRKLRMIKKTWPDVPVIAVTATATREVKDDIVRQLNLKDPCVLIGSFNRTNLNYEIRESGNAKGEIIAFLNNHRDESGIIYCFSRKSTEELSQCLRENGISSLPYHAGLKDNVRRKNQESFVRDKTQIICATVAFGMGINKPDIRFVIHYELPKDIESYYQETGRAGRDGLHSECILFYNRGDSAKQIWLIDKGDSDKDYKEVQKKKLFSLTRFCESPVCRRHALLTYFGEEYEQKNCEMCDNCRKENPRVDAKEYAWKVLACVSELNGQLGRGKIVQILSGSSAKEMESLRFRKLKSFGTVVEISEKQLEQWVDELVFQGYLTRSGRRYPVVSLSKEGKTYLNGQTGAPIFLSKPKKTGGKSHGGEKCNLSDVRYNQSLFSLLRVQRDDIARRAGLPKYMIFTDPSLIEMAAYYPQTKADFLNIKGVGVAKWNSYGDIFTTIISNFCIENGITGTNDTRSGAKK
ncbi:DNA helicase RecQ [Methanogenium marinum]|uniref:DNA 3'-5' helicase n=1 Tax=Methanogenium marinum TaxID=348610 RepID=A0A9Q4PYE2_9EURY|nr:DNA helicase RecQ [Methanogenium marinum]MDE4908533.1 DNA helicase RecQ [Methanogenium marinum]